MPHSSTIALGDIWEETLAFLRAELGLVASVSLLCFGLPLAVLLLVIPIPADGMVRPGPWIWYLLPAGLFSITGSLAIAALALRPGASVRECLAVAMRRMPAAIGLELLNAALQGVLAIPIVLASLAEGGGGTPGPAAMIANLAGIAFQIWLFVRVLPIWAALSETPLTPIGAVREAFRLTRGHYRKLLLLRVIALLAGFVMLMVLVIPIDSVFGLLGRLPGFGAAANVLGMVATAGVAAMLLTVWSVYCARLQRRLAAIAGPLNPR